MHPTHALLSERLRDFRIDDGGPAFSFEDRLARENGWTTAFARRVVAEYKRLVLLAVTAGHPVTPSAAVDEAWHLHLTYTRSYWDRLCGRLLGRPLHHDPTGGGPVEARRFRRQYGETLAAYRYTFGEVPPADIWPPADVRFGPDLSAVRVNPARYWLGPKAAVRRRLVGLATAGALVLVAGCEKGAGVGCLTALVIALGVTALGLAVGWAAWLGGRDTRRRHDGGAGAGADGGGGGCGGGDVVGGGGCGDGGGCGGGAGCGGGCGGCGGCGG